jgi:hypothetical protein
VRSVVMGYPGILYDELTAATRLGISQESFRDATVNGLIADAKYNGPFCDAVPYWWRGRLFAAAQVLIGDQGMRGSTSQTFAAAFNQAYDVRLDPAVCIVDNSPIADAVCYVLKRPVKERNSIPYYPDNRPAIMEQARVSVKAIQESAEFDEDLVADEDMAIVRELWGVQA